MKLYFIVVVLLLAACNKQFMGVVKVSPDVEVQSIESMPTEAYNVDHYVYWVADVTPVDSASHVSKQTIGQADTLHIWFSYTGPDPLPIGRLASSQEHSITIPNTGDLWDIDGDANLYWKDWVYLKPGKWQLTVTPFDANGNSAESGRYDFTVVGNGLVKVIIHGA